MNGALRVDLHGAFPNLVGKLVYGFEAHDACVIHEDVDRAEHIDRLAQRIENILIVHHVARADERLSPHGLYLFCEGFELVHRSGGEGEVRSLARIDARDGAADAARGARDECDFAF